jgi:hypothetical protein
LRALGYGWPVRIDHVIYATRDLTSAIRLFDEEYGLAASRGGVHPQLGTCNSLVAVGRRQYIELMAVADPAAGSILVESLTQALADGDGLFAVSVEPEDLEETAARLDLQIAEGERRSTSGRVIRWRMAGLKDAAGPRRLPFFVDWGDSDPDLDESQNVEVGGIAWVELGGDEQTVRRWLGEGVGLPLRFAAGPPGPRALGLRRGSEIVVIR